MPNAADTTYTVDRIQPRFRPDLAVEVTGKLKASTVFQKGSLVAWDTTNLLYAPYTNGDTQGRNKPVGILQYALTTDANGAYTFGIHSGPRTDAPIWIKGLFDTADLPQSGVGGLDTTNTLTDQAGWKLVQGTLAAGILDIG